MAEAHVKTTCAFLLLGPQFPSLFYSCVLLGSMHVWGRGGGAGVVGNVCESQ
jgi:hypothetical protein